MHRDIKPENFLLTDKSDKAVIKAADFGLCTYFKHGQRFRHIVGSAYYVAPEVLQKNYSYEADMWSLGVVLYILLCGLPPFWGDTGRTPCRVHQDLLFPCCQSWYTCSSLCNAYHHLYDRTPLPDGHPYTLLSSHDMCTCLAEHAHTKLHYQHTCLRTCLLRLS